MENNGIVVRRVVGFSDRKRSQVCVAAHFGKPTSFGEQRSPIFLLTTGAHRDSCNACFERRRDGRRSWFTRQEACQSCSSWTPHTSTRLALWCFGVGTDDRICSGDSLKKKRTRCISQDSSASKKPASWSLEWSVTGNAG